MALVTIAEAIEASSAEVTRRGVPVEAMLRESRQAPPTSKFDIFLSHSSMDRRLILGVRAILESKGFTVYVDWIDDPLLDRKSVTKTTAAAIRARMRQCRMMFYVHTRNAALSKWCPWELGYFDAFSNPEEQVYIFPLVESRSETFKGQEYLALYRVIDIANPLVRNRSGSDVKYVAAL